MIQNILKWAGLATVAVGVAGLALVAVHPLGIVDAYPTPPAEFVNGPLGRSEPIKSIETLYQRSGEPQTAYFERLTKSVAAGMIHYWSTGDSWTPEDEPYTRVSPWDNYLLWLHPLIPGYEHFRALEFITPSKAIDRGYGFCSQVSRIVHSILGDQGIPSRILANPQHVIVEANGQILDSDYGVYIPHSTVWMQSHPEAVASYYRGFEWMVPLLTQIYRSGWTVSGPEQLFTYMREYERRMEILKWIPPVLLIIVGLGMMLVGLPRSPLALQEAEARRS